MKTYNVLRFVICLLLPLILLAQGECWVYRYNGSGNGSDVTNSIVYGADSNIYAAGYCLGNDASNDIAVISLTNAGDTNWIYQYNAADCDDQVNSVIYGADGNIYVAGRSGWGSFINFIVISLSPIGDTNWVYWYDGYGTSQINSIVYGADGNIYAAGSSYGSSSNPDFSVISIATLGIVNWIYRYNGPGNSEDYAYSIVYGADGNIYAAGSSYGNGTSQDFTVLSLTTAHDTNWVYRYNGPGNGWDEARSIIYGADGNIYAAGRSWRSSTNYDFIVVSLSTAGDTNWVYRYNGPGNYNDYANSLIYGADGNIYAAGSSYASFTDNDFTVISLSPTGSTNWVYRYNGPENNNDYANSVVYGADGNIYTAGVDFSHTGNDFIVISLSPAGDANWIYRYNGPGNGDDRASDIVYGSDGNIYAAGYSTGNGTDEDFTVISLPPHLGVEEEKNIAVKTRTNATIINGPLQLPKDKKCRVFDITGRIVMPDKIKPGIYFIEVDGQIMQKVIKIR
ncbi:MAG TPA: hypothetical protein VF399_00840 [bacterium]